MAEGSDYSQVLPSQVHEVLCDVAELLSRGDYIYSLVEDPARLFPGEFSLAHIDQELHSHSAMLNVSWDC